MPAITVQDRLVLPRIPRPDPAASRGAAVTEVDREDWGLNWNVALETGGVLVGKRVRIELNVQAVASPKA
jgi:polyisoprenoid-binding protein YceI